MPEIFLDTAYAIALSASTDEHHQQGLELAAVLEARQTRIVTSRAVLLEIGSALARLRYRKAAVQLLESMEHDPTIEIVPLTEELYRRAHLLFTERSNKEWSLTDCLSFLIMGDRRIEAALTTDEHFQQAGFRALLREP